MPALTGAAPKENVPPLNSKPFVYIIPQYLYTDGIII